MRLKLQIRYLILFPSQKSLKIPIRSMNNLNLLILITFKKIKLSLCLKKLMLLRIKKFKNKLFNKEYYKKIHQKSMQIPFKLINLRLLLSIKQLKNLQLKPRKFIKLKIRNKIRV